jgi:hypothetical protein
MACDSAPLMAKAPGRHLVEHETPYDQRHRIRGHVASGFSGEAKFSNRALQSRLEFRMIITLPDVLDIGAIKCRYFRLIEHCFKESIFEAFTLAVLKRNFQEVRV